MQIFKKFLLGSLVFLGTIFLMLLGAEFYYRYLNPKVLGNTSSLSYIKWAKKNFKFNSWGFRDKERSLKKRDPKIYRVVFLGPSNVVGQGVSKIEERISERFERLLNSEFKEKAFYEVINAGTMTLELIKSNTVLLEKFLKAGVEFDSAVLYYNWTAIRSVPEVGRKYLEHKRGHYTKADPAFISYLKKNSYFYDWASNLSKDKSFDLDGKSFLDWHMDFYKNPEMMKLHLEDIKALDNLAKKHNKKFTLLITPISNRKSDREKYRDLLDDFKEKLQSLDIDFADASSIYDGVDDDDIAVSKYDGHNKPVFYEDMAETLLEEYVAKMK